MKRCAWCGGSHPEQNVLTTGWRLEALCNKCVKPWNAWKVRVAG